ncbi:MAG: ABC transporter permease [Firmicutes bacterium]|nr:ABC transporter permease [Bacillota bacterium]
MKTEFCNTSRLTGFIFRRERVVSIAWIVILAFFCLVVPIAFENLYPSTADLTGLLDMLKSPTMAMMMGPIYTTGAGINIGQLNAAMMILYSATAAAIMNIFLVVRHSRRDEERGRLEVVRSLPVGRLSNLGSVLIVALAVNLVLALVLGLGLGALGVDGITLLDGLTYGFAVGVCGLFFAAAAALIAQIFASSKSAIGVSFIVLGVAFIMRAYGDVSSETVSRVSPLGLVLRVQASAGDYWWPIVALFIVSAAVAAVALYLNSLRDVDQGFIAARPGKKTGRIRTPLGLALRLERGTLIGWAIGMFAIGAAYGSVLGDLGAFLNASDIIKQMFASNAAMELAPQFTAKILSMYAIVSAIPSLIILNKLRSEEIRGRAEQILARPVSRYRLLAAFLGIAAVTGVAMLFVVALGYYAAGYSVAPQLADLALTLRSSLIYIPAVLCTCALAAFLLGFFPRAQIINWIYLFVSFVVVYLGDILKMPVWLKRLTLYGNIPRIPIEDVRVWIMIVMIAAAAVLAAAGFKGFRERDLGA